MYFSAHLSSAQQKWHPYRQEFYALLCTVREAVKHFGRIPKVIHTDHATIVRQADLPLARIDPMDYRWMTELKQGGSLLLHRPGTSQSHQGPDGLSRNPRGAQSVILARKREWIAFRAEIKGIEQGLEEEDDEEKILPEPEENGLDFFHEDLVDNWKRSADPERSLGAKWTGRTECECADGNWVAYDHREPRETLFVPPAGETWTGRRHTVVKFVENLPFGSSSWTEGQVGAAPGSEAAPGPLERKGTGKKSSGYAPIVDGAPSVRGAKKAALMEKAMDEGLSFLEEALCSVDGSSSREGELRVLFLGPFALSDEVANASLAWKRRLTDSLGCPVSLVVGDPTYSEIDIECKGFWFKPHARKREEQVRKLRTGRYTCWDWSASTRRGSFWARSAEG